MNWRSSPHKQNETDKQKLGRVLEVLEEKDLIMKEMVERIRNQEKQIALIINQNQDHQQACKISFKLYREFLKHNQTNQKFIILKILENKSRNEPIWLSKNVQLVNEIGNEESKDYSNILTCCDMRLNQTKSQNIQHAQQFTQTDSRLNVEEALPLKKAQYCHEQTQTEAIDESFTLEREGTDLEKLDFQINHLKEQLAKYQQIIEQQKELREIEIMETQQEMQLSKLTHHTQTHKLSEEIELLKAKVIDLQSVSNPPLNQVKFQEQQGPTSKPSPTRQQLIPIDFDALTKLTAQRLAKKSPYKIKKTVYINYD